MALPEDVVRWVTRQFGGDVEPALAMLGSAVDQAGELVGPRLIRCAAVGSRGEFERLAALVAQLRNDWRDVIVAGEYEMRNGELIQVRDFNHPIADV
jgi:limonene-1,2-epoxide hydrolase